MPNVTRWKNRRGEYPVVIGLHADTGIWTDDRDKPIPSELQAAMGDYAEVDEAGGAAELVIEYSSSGYDDPGRFDGPAEKCYPPEGDDERLVTGAVVIDSTTKVKTQVAKELLPAIAEHWKREIDEEIVEE
jgi:hypothetical protein